MRELAPRSWAPAPTDLKKNGKKCIYFFLRIRKNTFHIRSAGTIIKASVTAKESSVKLSGRVRKVVPPKYIIIVCTAAIRIIIMIKALFFSRCAIRFILLVRAVKQLKIPRKINSAKNAPRCLTGLTFAP